MVKKARAEIDPVNLRTLNRCRRCARSRVRGRTRCPFRRFRVWSGEC